MILVDGVVTETVDARDRGLAYGDGVFRTLRTHAGQPVWWRDHYAKLAHDCAALGLVCPDEATLRREVEQVALPAAGAVKILVTRGVGERGYAAPSPVSCTRIVIATALPSHAQTRDDIEARWCTLRLAQQPRLAGVKHLNRLENVLARAEWDDASILEGLLCDSAGDVVGGVMSNVFWVKDGALSTPDLALCGVAGVTRARVLAVAERVGLRTHIVRQPRAAILAADEVMICNSLLGMRRIARLNEARWPEPARWTPVLNAALDEETD
jgi:4-amino-4-deoxychorismate lyase